jgi:hypothetical protein
VSPARSAALATAPKTGTLGVEKARQLLAQCKSVDEAKEIRDRATAVQVYLREQRASREAQNDAGEIKVRAERRLGQLLDEQKKTGERQGRGDAGRAAANGPKAQRERLAPEVPPAPAKTLEELGVDRNQAARWRAVAQVPEEKLETFIKAQREHPAGEITTAGLIRVANSRNPHAASRVNDGDPEKNERYTRKKLREALHRRFRFEVDAFGHPQAPMSKLIGAFYTREDNAYRQDFTKRRSFFQPPWDEIPQAVEFIHEQAEKGMPLGVLLGPATRTEQPYWHTFIEPYRPDRGGSGVRVEMIEGRENYGNPDDPECEDPENHGIGMASCLVIWEGERRRSSDHPLPGPPALPPEVIPVLISVDRFKGEATDLGFTARLTWIGTPRAEVLLVKCGRRGCQGDMRVQLNQERLVPRGELQSLRRHNQEAHGGKKRSRR